MGEAIITMSAKGGQIRNDQKQTQVLTRKSLAEALKYLAKNKDAKIIIENKRDIN